MKDVKVSRFKNPLKVTGISRLSNNITSIKGSEFNKASEVYINEELRLNWFAPSDSEILINLPNDLKILTVAVLTEELVLDILNLTFYELGSSLKSVEGLPKLIQNFINLLVRTPGTNKFNPFGGGLLKLPGRMINDEQNVKLEVVNAINRTKNYLINRQNKDSQVPLSEKLLNVEVLAINIGKELDMTVSLSIKNKVGEESVVNV